MLNDPLFIAVAIAVLIVTGILLMGIGNFAKSSSDQGKKSNRLMQYRIYAQAGAVVLIVLYVWIRN